MSKVALDLNAIILALIGTAGVIYTGYAARQRSKKASPIDQAQQVSTMATEQMTRMGERLEKLEGEVEVLEAENDSLKRRVVKLETIIIRNLGEEALTEVS